MAPVEAASDQTPAKDTVRETNYSAWPSLPSRVSLRAREAPPEGALYPPCQHQTTWMSHWKQEFVARLPISLTKWRNDDAYMGHSESDGVQTSTMIQRTWKCLATAHRRGRSFLDVAYCSRMARAWGGCRSCRRCLRLADPKEQIPPDLILNVVVSVKADFNLDI